jgi:hypothetical protein
VSAVPSLWGRRGNPNFFHSGLLPPSHLTRFGGQVGAMRLAMTNSWFPDSVFKQRGIAARILATGSVRAMPDAMPSETVEGAGKAGCPLHPRPTRRKNLARARVDHRYRRNHFGLPCAVVYDLLRALLGEPACCHRHLREAHACSKTWRLHGRARTTRLRRPRKAPLVDRPLRVRRIPPRVRDDASAPRAEAGRTHRTLFYILKNRIIFFAEA